eukprot:CAMPEP_0179027300 /NCGR_PEP_ID=MMETSP0796-20121207/8968_1 /TAXON_ID=73915 /ORGANISM="Pyrodinium bahamense, Strain pbaha01" /LENGTH=296 /DNA_ID=CAMNT_0020723425 /DNA_START=66 /DNA_END=952 /DNA_ORIENTATION=-
MPLVRQVLVAVKPDREGREPVVGDPHVLQGLARDVAVQLREEPHGVAEDPAQALQPVSLRLGFPEHAHEASVVVLTTGQGASREVVAPKAVADGRMRRHICSNEAAPEHDVPPVPSSEAAPVDITHPRCRISPSELWDIRILVLWPRVKHGLSGDRPEDLTQPLECLPHHADTTSSVRENADFQLHAHVQRCNEHWVVRPEAMSAREGAHVLRDESAVELQEAERVRGFRDLVGGPEGHQEALLDRAAVPPALPEDALVALVPGRLHEPPPVLACLGEDPRQVHDPVAAEAAREPP